MAVFVCIVDHCPGNPQVVILGEFQVCKGVEAMAIEAGR
jgi:hypothetical protein